MKGGGLVEGVMGWEGICPDKNAMLQVKKG
jgi:hypothetical protein